MKENMKEKLLKIIQQHPEAEVEIMVNSEEMSEDHRYSWHMIQSVDLYPWIEYSDTVYTDYDEFIDELVSYYEAYETIEEAEKAFPLEETELRIVIFTGAA